MSSALRKEDFFVSPEEYLVFERLSDVRHEYVNGTLRAMNGETVRGMAGATRAHVQITGNLVRELGNQLRGKPCTALSSDIKVRIRSAGAQFYYYPDVVVDCAAAPDPRSLYAEEPAVIFEVESLESQDFDRAEKFANYCTLPTLRAYVRINQFHAAIFVHRRPAAGAVNGGGLEWTTEFLGDPDATLALPEIDCALPLAAIYERVRFF
jgi:Uma2 family endonuclease